MSVHIGNAETEVFVEPEPAPESRASEEEMVEKYIKMAFSREQERILRTRAVGFDD